MSVLDFRFNQIINDKILSKKIRFISKKKQKYYFELINKINCQNSNNLLWISSISSSRNIFRTRIFYYLCLKELIDENSNYIKKFSNIYIDNDQILKLLIDKNIDKKKIFNSNSILKSSFLKFKGFLINIIQLIICKLFLSKLLISNENILFQVPISIQYSLQKSIGNLRKILNQKNFNKIIFVPYLITKNLSNIFFLNKLKKEKNILFIQTYLSFFDYLKIFKNYYKKNYLTFPNKINNFEKIIIQKEFQDNLFDPVSFNSLEYFYFIKKVSNLNYKLKFFSIFENSPVNKLWHMAINNFINPNILNYGIKVMIPVKKYFSQYYIISSENFLKLLPSKIFLSSDILKSQLSKDNPLYKDNYINGPNLRNSFSTIKSQYTRPSIVFFSSILEFETNLILNLLKKIQPNKNYDYFIKFHPSFQNHSNFNLPKFFTINENLNINQLKKNSIIISGMSSILVDSLEYNFKSIYVDTNFYLDLNPMLTQFNKSYSYKILRPYDNINNVIKSVISNENSYKKNKIYNDTDSVKFNNFFND